MTPADPRSAFYYGWRPDSAAVQTDTRHHGARSFARACRRSSIRSRRPDLPFYTLDDFEDADFARADSLTRGQVFVRGRRRATSPESS